MRYTEESYYVLDFPLCLASKISSHTFISLCSCLYTRLEAELEAHGRVVLRVLSLRLCNWPTARGDYYVLLKASGENTNKRTCRPCVRDQNRLRHPSLAFNRESKESQRGRWWWWWDEEKVAGEEAAAKENKSGSRPCVTSSRGRRMRACGSFLRRPSVRPACVVYVPSLSMTARLVYSFFIFFVR